MRKSYPYFLVLGLLFFVYPFPASADLVADTGLGRVSDVFAQIGALLFTMVIEVITFLIVKRFIQTSVTIPLLLGVNLMSHSLAWNLFLFLTERNFPWIVCFLLVEGLVIAFEARFFKSWKIAAILNTVSALLGVALSMALG